VDEPKDDIDPETKMNTLMNAKILKASMTKKKKMIKLQNNDEINS
jgi:hypothetical protein